jgi:hypothetical protein
MNKQWSKICIVSIRGVKRQLLINQDQIILKGISADEGYLAFNSMEEVTSFLQHVEKKGIEVKITHY